MSSLKTRIGMVAALAVCAVSLSGCLDTFTLTSASIL